MAKPRKVDPKSMNIGGVVRLTRPAQFIVLDQRPGRGFFHKAHTVVALAPDWEGVVRWFAFADDTMSFEEAKHFKAVKA